MTSLPVCLGITFGANQKTGKPERFHFPGLAAAGSLGRQISCISSMVSTPGSPNTAAVSRENGVMLTPMIKALPNSHTSPMETSPVVAVNNMQRSNRPMRLYTTNSRIPTASKIIFMVVAIYTAPSLPYHPYDKLSRFMIERERKLPKPNTKRLFGFLTIGMNSPFAFPENYGIILFITLCFFTQACEKGMTATVKKLALLLSLILVVGCSGRDKQTPPAEGSSAPEGDSSLTDTANNADYDQPVQLLQFQQVTPEDTLVVIETTLGTIKAKLFPEKAPKAVNNFIGLAQQGYYTGKIFHRIIPQFMAQGGSPNGDGLGGESIYKDEKGASLPFEDEFSMDLWHFRGALSMANSGPNSNMSQFFIVEGYPVTDEMLDQMQQAQFPAPVIEKYRELGGTPHLDWQHTVFGQVVEGLEVLEAMMAVSTKNDKPLEDIIILSIQVANPPETAPVSS